MIRPIVENGRIKVRAIVPNERPELSIQTHRPKHCRFAQRAIQLAPQDGLEVNKSFEPVIEANSQPVAGSPFEFNHVIKRVHQQINLTERFDGRNPLASLKSCPIAQQLNPMQFSPSFDEATLPRRECAGKNRQVRDLEYSLSIGRDRVEVRAVVPLAGFYKHANDQAIESRQFGHESRKTTDHGTGLNHG